LTDYYILAYTEFCRAVTAPGGARAREQVAHRIDWLAQQMPGEDQRVVGLRSVLAILPSTEPLFFTGNGVLICYDRRIITRRKSLG